MRRGVKGRGGRGEGYRGGALEERGKGGGVIEERGKGEGESRRGRGSTEGTQKLYMYMHSL